MRKLLFSTRLMGNRKCTAKLFSVLGFIILSVAFAQSAQANYPVAQVKNNTDYTITGEVQYISFLCSDDGYSVAPGATWTASTRGACLIDAITGSTGGATAKFGEKMSVVSYSSTGTSYSKFQINAYSGAYRIFSEEEYASVSDTRRGKSPGFYFVNKTAWPLGYSLDQVGCLHHGIIPTGAGKGGILKVDTGAVWFTMRIHIQPDGVNPQTDWDCVEPVAELVADVALAAVTGGGTAVAKAGGKIVVKQVVKAVIKAGAKAAVKKMAAKLVKDLAKDELGKLLKGAGSVELYGQYAGYTWPFRCDKMPEYHIIGGPEPLKDENGEIYLRRGTPFKVMKVNTCGDDMMLGSRRSMESDQSSFSSWPSGASTTAAAKLRRDPSCVTFYSGTNGGGDSVTLCGKLNKEYVNLGKPGTSLHYKVKSFRCNKGVKSVQFINGNAKPWARHNESCKGGNTVNPSAWVKAQATGVGMYSGYCCGEGPQAKAAAKAAAAKVARETAARLRREASCVTFYTAQNGGGASLTICGVDDNNFAKPYINLGNPGKNDFHGQVRSFRCRSGVKYVQFINGNANPWGRFDEYCKGSNIVNTRHWVQPNATGFALAKK